MLKCRSLYNDLKNDKLKIAFVQDILAIRRVGSWFTEDRTLESVIEKVDLRNSGYVEIIGAVYEVYADSKSKPIWGDKTPKNLYRIDTIKKLFPHGNIIIVERDGRDIALSLKKVAFGMRTVATSAIQWRDYIREARNVKKKYGNDVLIIKFEDFLQNPGDVSAAMLEHAGLNLDLALISKYYKHDDVSHSKSQYYRQKITKAYYEKWKKNVWRGARSL